MVVVEVNGYTIEPGACLESANLLANLTGANLFRANTYEDNIWPEGFDPEAAGLNILDRPSGVI